MPAPALEPLSSHHFVHAAAGPRPTQQRCEWQTGRSFGDAFIRALPPEESLSSAESKQARSLLAILPMQIKGLAYQDFRLLMGMAVEVVAKYSDYQKRASDYLIAAQEALSTVSEAERPALERKIQQGFQILEQDRPRSLTERLKEQIDVVRGGVDVWRHGVNILSSEALPVVETLSKLLDLDMQRQPPMLVKLEGKFGPTADENFANQMLRILRVSFPGGVNIRHPEQASQGQGVFKDFESLRIGIGNFHAGVTLTPCRAGYRYHVQESSDPDSAQGVLPPGQTLLCGREGSISFSVAEVKFKLPQDEIDTAIRISAPHVSRAAIEIAALPSGGVVVVDRGSRSDVVFELTEHGSCRTVISGIFRSVASENGFLGLTQESRS